MTTLKALKPPKLAFSKAQTKALAIATTDTLNTMKKDFERTTQGWKTPVRFTVQKALNVTETAIRGAVGTENKIYGYVNNGTRPHIIRPRRAKALRFQAGYKAKTQFRVLASRSGGAYGATVYAQFVRHPGNAPREFDYAIADMRQPDFEKAIQHAITKAASEGNA